MILLAVCVMIALAGEPMEVGASGPALAGPVTHVRDGDTIEVRGVPVRIANLDCAERGQIGATRATQRARDLTGAGPLTCQLEGRMSYDRQVGTCALADGRDMGEVMIREGVCRRWR